MNASIERGGKVGVKAGVAKAELQGRALSALKPNLMNGATVPPYGCL
jgi:hypothetical protein